MDGERREGRRGIVGGLGKGKGFAGSVGMSLRVADVFLLGRRCRPASTGLVRVQGGALFLSSR